MSDIFHEVDEEVRREQLRKFWDRYSIYLIALAVIVVAGVGGWRGYEWWQGKQAARAGSAFEAAIALSEAGKQEEAAAKFEQIAADAPGGYRVLSQLRAAAAVAQLKTDEGVKSYDEIAADPSVPPALQDLAAVRAGMLLVDTAPLAEMRRRLVPLAEPARVFRHSARELLALSAWRNHDLAAARGYIEAIAADSETPPGTRTRMEVLAALIGAAGSS